VRGAQYRSTAPRQTLDQPQPCGNWGRCSAGRCGCQVMVSHAEVSSLLPPGTVQQPAPTSRPGKLTPLGGAPGKLAPLGNATSAPSRLSTQQAYLTPEPTTSTCGLTPEQIKELRGKYNWMTESALISLGELFTEWDEDGTGEISCEEMGATLSKVVRELFDKLDTDKSGSLTKKEVERLCHNLGMSVSNKEVDKWVQDMKRDSENPKGDVSFQDFERWWNGHEDGEVTEEELKDLFEEVPSPRQLS
jgi:Ca2+-binding EF-hand superfamily protein